MIKTRVLWILNYAIIFVLIFGLVLTIMKSTSSTVLNYVIMLLFIMFNAILQKFDDLDELLHKLVLK